MTKKSATFAYDFRGFEFRRGSQFPIRGNACLYPRPELRARLGDGFASVMMFVRGFIATCGSILPRDQFERPADFYLRVGPAAVRFGIAGGVVEEGGRFRIVSRPLA